MKDQFKNSFMLKNKCVILSSDEISITVGVLKKPEENLIKMIENSYNKKVQIKKITAGEFNKLTENENEIDGEIINTEEEPDESEIITLVHSIIEEAINQNASDIHFECEKEYCKIRYRITGDLKERLKITKKKFDACSARIKILASLNIIEKRNCQDGKFSFNYKNKNMDIRVSTIPSINGESIVLRLLGKSSKKKSFEEIGFCTTQSELLRKMIKIPHGLIIVSGPTGSGKTTTLNAIIEMLKSPEKKIITIEDPVEYTIEGITQIQTNETIGLTFSKALRQVLRQDPNIIMVGEIRDKETAELCIRAALTGHLVLSTIHTNDSIGIISRLKDLSIEPYLISSVLKGAVAQRLVKSADGKRKIISEVFLCDEEISKLITKDESKDAIKKYLIKKNMIFLKDDAKNKIKKGIINKEEAEKEIEF